MTTCKHCNEPTQQRVATLAGGVVSDLLIDVGVKLENGDVLCARCAAVEIYNLQQDINRMESEAYARAQELLG